MAKQKKNKTISNLDKTLGRIMGFQTQNPTEFRKMMDDFKKQYKTYSEKIGLTGNPSLKPNVPKESLQLFYDICQEKKMEDYIFIVRTLLVGYWNTHRIVYSFTKEAIDFMENDLDIKNYRLSICALQESAANEPILIELPPGYPIQRAFFGRVSFFNEAVTNNFTHGEIDYCLFSCMIYKDESYAMISAAKDMSVRETMKEKTRRLSGQEEAVWFLTELVSYIGYMRGMKDTNSAVFEEEPIKDGIRYKVLPAHSESPTADETIENGWVRAGLAPIMGYYDRRNMIQDFYKELHVLSQGIASVDMDGTEESAVNFTKKMVLSWENSRNLYGFTNELAISVAVNMISDMLYKGFPSDLLDYMPYHVMAFYPTEQNALVMALISRCTLKGGIPGVFLFIPGHVKKASSFYFFEENQPLLTDDMDSWFEENDADTALILCIFKYTLQILQRKTLRKMGDNNQSVTTRQRLQHEHPPIPSIPIIRQGSDVSDIVPVAMYDLTKRTVRRVPGKEVVRRNGWKMTPHTRRRHPHRYWVGRGEDRHLEVRWLETISVNKKDNEAVPAVTVHEVK